MFSKIRNFSEDVAKSLNDLNLTDQQNQAQQSKPDPLAQLQRNARILQAETPDSNQLTQPKDESESDVPSRISTPANNGDQTPSSTKQGTPPVDSSTVSLDELPPAIKSKMKKFAKYEEKYPVLLEAYKVEKRKTELIKIFENVLKENTPVSSISDARTLVEYLNGLNEKTKMQNNEIRKLTKENSVLTFKIAKYEEEGEDTLFRKIEDLKKENDGLKKQVSDHESKIKTLNEEKDKLEKRLEEKDKLTDEQAKVEKEESVAQNESETPSGDNDYKENIKELKSKLLDKDKELEDVRVKLQRANKSLEEKKDEIEDLRDSMKDIGNDLVTAKDEIKDLRSKVKNGNSEGDKITDTSHVDMQEKNLEKQISTLADEVKSWKDKVSQKTKEVKELQTKVTTLEDESHEEQLANKQSESQLRKEIQSLKKQLNDQNENLSNTEKQLNAQKAEREKLEQRLHELSKFKSNDTSYKLEVSSLQSNLDHKEETIKELKSKIESLNENSNTLQTKIDKLEKTNNELQTNYMGLLKNKNELLTKQESFIESEKSLNVQLSKLQKEKQEIRNELDKTRSSLDSLLSEKSSASNDVQSYKRQYDELTMKSKEYNLRIESLEDDLSESRNLLQERTREGGNLRRLLIETDEMMKQKESDHKLEIRRLEDEKTEFERSSNQLIKKKQKDIDELNVALKEHKQRISNLEERLKVIEAVPHNESVPENNQIDSELQVQINTLREALSVSSNKLKDYEKLNSNLKKLNDDNLLKFERLSKNYKLLTQQYRLMKDNESRRGSAESVTNSLVNGSERRESLDEKKDKDKQTDTNIAYLKNVLLGYFEHKEQREQLLPVLKTIFQFSKDDENKFLLALK
ncbi:IMH1 [Candida margitis]|uniref:IMH1 n=1 Tax=Candida margitis TaxID=1775924 RepID=UPI00222693B1|nr:IMH1 [Candida margitis]KAI5967713.1 IMH1 [Candida margitis]